MNFRERLRRYGAVMMYGGARGVLADSFRDGKIPEDHIKAATEAFEPLAVDVATLIEATKTLADYVDNRPNGNDWEEDDIITAVRVAIAAFEDTEANDGEG